MLVSQLESFPEIEQMPDDEFVMVEVAIPCSIAKQLLELAEGQPYETNALINAALRHQMRALKKGLIEIEKVAGVPA